MPGERETIQVIDGIPASDGAGVSLQRVIGHRGLTEADPFLLLDEFRSDDASDYIAGFPEHPHRGFETVTYMLAGRMRHRDSEGNQGILSPGSVQWMTAGRGIVHSEMPEQEEGLLHGFQLWVNLPAANKLCAPRYQDIPPKDVPSVEIQGGSVRIVAGSFNGVEGPVRGVSVAPLYLDITITKHPITIPLDDAHTGLAYVVGGGVAIGANRVAANAGQLARLGRGHSVTVQPTTAEARVLMIAGRPLGEPVARYGPFVMNTEQEIRQAIEDFQRGRF
ncbi:MAG: pirin family protein [Pseudomonadota bacterium]